MESKGEILLLDPEGKGGAQAGEGASLSSRLRSLHDISLELSLLPDRDSLYRRSVEWGLERLGFDRLGLWFLDPADPDWNLGTWGTDEEGRLRDERGARVRRDSLNVPPDFYDGKVPILVFRDRPCYDHRRVEVGRGDKAIAPLWDGRRIVGDLYADNLLSARHIDRDSLELLVLFARIVGQRHSIIEAKESLVAANEEKAFLLRELRHRTRNSIAVIESLVSLELGRAGDQAWRVVLEGLRDRVNALSALYSLLDGGDSGGSIRLDEYLGAVAARLAESHGAAERGVALDLELAPLGMDARRAASLGLALGELIADSLKHAFPGGRAGTVSVRLSAAGGAGHLEVADDGVGLPPGIDASTSTGLGLGLVAVLASQLKGEFGITSGGGPGARFSLRFPL